MAHALACCLRPALLGALVFSTGCTGENASPAPSSSAAGAGGVNGGPGRGPATADCGVPNAPRAPIRRLTHFEYNRTVRDLLGDATSPADAFPGEQLGNGFGNDADAQPVSTLLAEQYIVAAEQIAARATAPELLGNLAPCAAERASASASDATTERACAQTIVERFATRAYRRPLGSGEAEELLALYDLTRSTSTFASGVAAMLEVLLQSSNFLYRPELGLPEPGRTDLMRPTGDEMASRLSYFLWGSMPDDDLRAAAAAGQLVTNEGVLATATRMLDDARSRPVIRFFFDKLLPIEGLSALKREPTLFPTFTAAMGGLMREETQTFLEHQIFRGPGSWPSVFTADYTFVNGALAAFYGLPGVTGDAFQQVALDTTQRLGLLTQAGMVAGTVHSNRTSPVVRGNFIVKKLMCRVIPLPTGDLLAQVKEPEPYTGATARERFTIHSQNPACATCHQQMDPLGFALENFDAVGLWRAQENNVNIDASGEVPALAGAFGGPVELARKLAESEEVQTCFAQHWLNFAYGRLVGEGERDRCSVDFVRSAFQNSGYNVKALLIALTESDAFRYLPAARE